MKKITAFMLAAVMFLGTAANVGAFYPQTLQNDSQGQAKPQFTDDFSIDLSKWKADNFEIHDGKAANKNDWGTLSAEDNIYFADGIIDVDFTIKNRTGDDAYVFFNFKPDTAGKTTLFLRKDKVCYLNPYESHIADCNFDLDKEYSMRFVLQDGTVSVQLQDGGKYTKLADVVGAGKERGGFNISLYKTAIEISRVEAYNNDSLPVKFTDKAPVIEADAGEVQLEVSNATGKSLIWTSSDEEVAAVDENGVVTPKKPGKTVVTAQTADGKQDTCSVIVISRIKAMAFHKGTLDMYVGENEELFINYEPSSANNKDFKWSLSSADGVAELFGDTIRSKAVCAKKPGQVKVIAESADTGVKCECLVTVTEKPPVETRSVEFELNGDAHKIPEQIFGMHTGNSMYAVSGGYAVPQESLAENDRIEMDMLPEIKTQTVRSIINSWSPLTGKSLSPEFAGEGSLTYTVEDYYKVPNTLNIPQIVCLSTRVSVDENIETVKVLKATAPDKPLYVEFGNETYAIAFVDDVPTVEDYIEKLKEFSTRARELIPDIKIAVPSLGYDMTEAIKNDPNNFPTSELDLAYTQGTRAITWDSTLAANREYYDAIVVHTYPDTLTLNYREKDLMRYISQIWSGDCGIKHTARYFNDPEIEIWVTEYGILSDFMWDANFTGNRDRYQHLKSVGAAITCAAEVFRFVDRGTITFSNYHCFNDSQGFGVVQNGTKLPQFYAFGKVGELLENNNWYYGMYASTTNAYTLSKKNYNGETRTFYAPDVEGWALGTADEVKQMVFLNCSEQPTEVKVKNASLKPTWRYWSEHPFPDYLVNKTGWTDLPAEIPLPEELNEAESDTITLKPFSFTVVDVKMTKGDEITPELRDKMTRSVFISKTESRAYGKHFKKTNLDVSNHDIKPVERGGKLYIPVRFAAQAFDVDEYYDSEKQELKLSIGQIKKYIREGDSKFDLVTDTTVRYYEREPVEMADAPIRINDRIYLPVETLAKLLDVNVVYSDENSVILSEENPTFTKAEADAMLRMVRQ